MLCYTFVTILGQQMNTFLPADQIDVNENWIKRNIFVLFVAFSFDTFMFQQKKWYYLAECVCILL